jgi:hypothetical protein
MSNKSFSNSERFVDYIVNLSVKWGDGLILSSVHQIMKSKRQTLSMRLPFSMTIG